MLRRHSRRQGEVRRLFRMPPHFETLEDRNLLSVTGNLDFSGLRTNTDLYEPSSVIVHVRPGDTDGPSILSFGGLTTQSHSLGGGLWQISLPPGMSVDKALQAFEGEQDVAYAQPDFKVQIDRIPNDSSFGSLWGLNNTGQSNGTVDADIDAAEAWDISTGGRNNTIVGIIDTGVDYRHPDLAANAWTNAGEIAGDGVDNDGNGYIDDIHGYDFVNNDGDPMDDNGHGTHVAGTVGAVGNNGIGVAGVNWSVRLMGLKFLDASGSGSTSNAIRALNYAVQMGAHLTNNSWGGGGYSQALYDAINRARTSGQIFVAAAGNSGANIDTGSFYPANYALDNVVSVGASDRNDAVASFSNYGARNVDLFAPGVSILSTTPNNTYRTFNGTSMASPHVAGALALLRDLDPTMTYSQLISRMLTTVDVKAAFQGKSVTGGRLNVAAMLGTAPPVDTSGARISAAVFSGATSGTIDRIRVTFSESVQGNTFTTGDVQLTGPNGQPISTAVASVAGSTTQFDITFTSQNVAGTYEVVIGPDILDLANNKMNQNGNGSNGEVPADSFLGSVTLSSATTYTVTPNLTIGDQATVNSTLDVAADLNLTDVNVRINITHTWDGDLRITLIPPWGGTGVRLVNRRGGSGDNFTNTILDDEAATAISAGRAPFAGSFRPEASLSTFEGRNVRGRWTLRVQDMASGDVGRLNSWSLIVQGDPLLQTSIQGIRESELTSMLGALSSGLVDNLARERNPVASPIASSIPTPRISSGSEVASSVGSTSRNAAGTPVIFAGWGSDENDDVAVDEFTVTSEDLENAS